MFPAESVHSVVPPNGWFGPRVRVDVLPSWYFVTVFDDPSAAVVVVSVCEPGKEEVLVVDPSGLGVVVVDITVSPPDVTTCEDEPSGCVVVVDVISDPKIGSRPLWTSVTEPSALVVRLLVEVSPAASVVVSEKSPFGFEVRSHDSPVVGFPARPLTTLPSLS